MVIIIPEKLPKLICSLKMRPTTKRQPPQNSSIVITAVTWALTRMLREFCLWFSSESPRYSLFLGLTCLLNEQYRYLLVWCRWKYYTTNFRIRLFLTCSCDRKYVNKRRSPVRLLTLHMLLRLVQCIQFLLRYSLQYCSHFPDQDPWCRKKRNLRWSCLLHFQ